MHSPQCCPWQGHGHPGGARYGAYQARPGPCSPSKAGGSRAWGSCRLGKRQNGAFWGHFWTLLMQHPLLGAAAGAGLRPGAVPIGVTGAIPLHPTVCQETFSAPAQLCLGRWFDRRPDCGPGLRTERLVCGPGPGSHVPRPRERLRAAPARPEHARWGGCTKSPCAHCTHRPDTRTGDRNPRG